MSTAALYIIGNPAASRGRVAKRFRQLERLLAGRAEFGWSQAPGHAAELAFAAAHQGYATIVAAGGDGTVHEVANGVLRAGRAEVAFGVIPMGSGNDYAAALHLPSDLGQLCHELLNGDAWAVDVGEVADNCGRRRFFVNTLGLGLSGAVTWESRQIHGLRGLALYGLAALRAIHRHFRPLDTVLSFDGQSFVLPTLYLALALGQREGGGFIVAPDAKLDDGLFDYLHAGPMSRWQALGYLPRMALGRLPENDPVVRRGQCREFAISCKTPMIIHLDGEIFATPSDGVYHITATLRPRRLAVRGSAPTHKK
jgi:YegS/Rv2252/BmrU family lipid kinase